MPLETACSPRCRRHGLSGTLSAQGQDNPQRRHDTVACEPLRGVREAKETSRTRAIEGCESLAPLIKLWVYQVDAHLVRAQNARTLHGTLENLS